MFLPRINFTQIFFIIAPLLMLQACDRTTTQNPKTESSAANPSNSIGDQNTKISISGEKADQSTQSDEKMELLSFEKMKPLNFSELTQKQKIFLKDKGVPTSEADVSGGSSNATYKPVIVKFGKDEDTIVIDGSMNMRMSDGNIEKSYSLHNLTTLTDIRANGLEEVESSGPESLIRFAEIDGKLIRILKVEKFQVGNFNRGNLKCINKGIYYVFNESSHSFEKGKNIELGTECPRQTKNPKNLPQIDEKNSALRDTFVNDLFKKLFTESSIQLGKNQ